MAERPQEAPANSIEKKISRRELTTNSWNGHINLFIPKKKGLTNETFLKFVRLTSYGVQK